MFSGAHGELLGSNALFTWIPAVTMLPSNVRPSCFSASNGTVIDRSKVVEAP